MSETMLARVAQAIFQAADDLERGPAERCARAAIEAMREPTEVMVLSGDNAIEQTSSDTNGSWYFMYYDGDAAKVWQAMLDAALNKPT